MYGNKRASLTKGNPPPGRRLSPIHPHSVVPKEVVGRGDAPAQGHRRWCGILCVSSWSWPCAWVLPLEFAHSSPSIPLNRCPPQLSHSPPFSFSASSPCLPAGAVGCSSWGWSSMPHPVTLVGFAGLLSIPCKFPPSGCHFGSSQIFGQRFGSHVGVEEKVGTQFGDFGCLPSHRHPRFGVFLAPQDEVCRCLWWCAAAAASSFFGVAGGDFAEVAVEVSVASSQLCGG